MTDQLDAANKTIESYKDMKIEDIKQSAEDWKTKAEEAQTKIREMEENTALEKAIAEYDTIDGEVIAKLLDRGTLKFTDGQVLGLSDQMKELKASKPYLFKAEEEEEPQDKRFRTVIPKSSDELGAGESAKKTSIADMASKTRLI